MYFSGLNGEYNLTAGFDLREQYGHGYAIKTDNWGYFEIAFKDAWGNTDSDWKDYDCFLIIILTGCITGVLWLIECSINVHALRFGWALYGCKVPPEPIRTIESCLRRNQLLALPWRECVHLLPDMYTCD